MKTLTLRLQQLFNARVLLRNMYPVDLHLVCAIYQTLKKTLCDFINCGNIIKYFKYITLRYQRVYNTVYTVKRDMLAFMDVSFMKGHTYTQRLCSKLSTALRILLYLAYLPKECYYIPH